MEKFLYIDMFSNISFVVEDHGYYIEEIHSERGESVLYDKTCDYGKQLFIFQDRLNKEFTVVRLDN